MISLHTVLLMLEEKECNPAQYFRELVLTSHANRVRKAQTNSLTFSKADGASNSNWKRFVQRQKSNF